jgi:hypothetical protein
VLESGTMNSLLVDRFKTLSIQRDFTNGKKGKSIVMIETSPGRFSYDFDIEPPKQELVPIDERKDLPNIVCDNLLEEFELMNVEENNKTGFSKITKLSRELLRLRLIQEG